MSAGRVGTSWGGRSVRLATRLSPIDSLPKVRQPPPALDRSLATSPRPYQHPVAVPDSLNTLDSLDTHISCQPSSALSLGRTTHPYLRLSLHRETPTSRRIFTAAFFPTHSSPTDITRVPNIDS